MIKQFLPEHAIVLLGDFETGLYNLWYKDQLFPAHKVHWVAETMLIVSLRLQKAYFTAGIGYNFPKALVAKTIAELTALLEDNVPDRWQTDKETYLIALTGSDCEYLPVPSARFAAKFLKLNNEYLKLASKNLSVKAVKEWLISESQNNYKQTVFKYIEKDN